MAEHNKLGNSGEKEANDYLCSKGYKIRHTNWRCGKLELDIIAEKDNILIVVEVKTRSSSHFGNPEEAINTGKIRKIIQATEEYIFRHNWEGETRFDIISVVPQGKAFIVYHIEDAFLPPVN